jgi:hypothetical protein
MVILEEVLPSSRTQVVKGAVWRGEQGWWVPIFCANCGSDGGLVPEVNKSFAFYLCVPCYEKHGLTAGLMAVPEEVFWAKVNAEMLDKYGRILPPTELQEVIDAGLTPLSALFQEKPAS